LPISQQANVFISPDFSCDVFSPHLQGAASGSIIDAVLCPNAPQLYYARVNGNASFSLMLAPIQSVHVIKNAIASAVGVNPGQLHITAKGKRLDSRHSLLNLGIESGSWLDCVVVPSTFGASTAPQVNRGTALARSLAHATAAQQLVMRSVYGDSIQQPSASQQP
jgi:hypothetical protein